MGDDEWFHQKLNHYLLKVLNIWNLIDTWWLWGYTVNWEIRSQPTSMTTEGFEHGSMKRIGAKPYVRRPQILVTRGWTITLAICSYIGTYAFRIYGFRVSGLSMTKDIRDRLWTKVGLQRDILSCNVYQATMMWLCDFAVDWATIWLYNIQYV